MTTTKEQDFKLRFVEMLRDLQQNGSKDKEAMWLLGSLAADLADDLKSPNWSSAKQAMDRATYDTLLRTFETQGNAHHREGRTAHSYAIQVLAISLIALTQTADPHIASGEVLLDQIIDRSAALYRQAKLAQAN